MLSNNTTRAYPATLKNIVVGDRRDRRLIHYFFLTLNFVGGSAMYVEDDFYVRVRLRCRYAHIWQ